MEQRAAIKVCVILKKTATETFEILKSVYGEEYLLRTSVFEWHKRFKEGQESLQDDERQGRPSTSRTICAGKTDCKRWKDGKMKSTNFAVTLCRLLEKTDHVLRAIKRHYFRPSLTCPPVQLVS
jgi:hypothetical protein